MRRNMQRRRQNAVVPDWQNMGVWPAKLYEYEMSQPTITNNGVIESAQLGTSLDGDL